MPSGRGLHGREPDFSPPDGKAPVGWFASRPAPRPVRSEAVAEPIDPNWWTLFQDPQLTALEDRVAAQNLDVKLAHHPHRRIPRPARRGRRRAAAHAGRQRQL